MGNQCRGAGAARQRRATHARHDSLQVVTRCNSDHTFDAASWVDAVVRGARKGIAILRLLHNANGNTPRHSD
eukprot:4785526-Pyramimonas_sp.AAC.1